MIIPPTGDYRINATRSTITFHTRHLFGLGAVRGTFALRDGYLQVTDPVLGSSARATIAADSFHTGNSGRDRTVRSAGYLNVATHPDITFHSGHLARDDDRWVLRGSLTVCGRTRPVELAIETTGMDGARPRLTATTRIDRYAFGVTKMKGMAARWLTLRLDLVADRV